MKYKQLRLIIFQKINNLNFCTNIDFNFLLMSPSILIYFSSFSKSISFIVIFVLSMFSIPAFSTYLEYLDPFKSYARKTQLFGQLAIFLIIIKFIV